MKKLLLLVFSVSFSLSSFAQWDMNIDFENGADSIITIDTVIMPNNQWQIGVPSKTYFDSAYSPMRALMTDTLNPYYGPSVSRAEIKIGNPSGGGWYFGYVSGSLYHKFNTDSLTDGCSIEFSYDNGLSFVNLNNYVANGNGYIQHMRLVDGVQFFEDSLPNDKIGLSGNSGDWINTQFQIFNCNIGNIWKSDSLIFHFVFRANSENLDSLDGWLIDNIQISTGYCESVPEHTLFTSTLYPNPATHSATLEFENPTNTTFGLQIFDITGRVVMEQGNITNNRIQLNTQHLPAGIYHYQLISEKEKKQSFGRFVAE
ncbi:MAG: T9SS type A sorting domain-containing protein [Bacteroidia bacterium]